MSMARNLEGVALAGAMGFAIYAYMQSKKKAGVCGRGAPCHREGGAAPSLDPYNTRVQTHGNNQIGVQKHPQEKGILQEIWDDCTQDAGAVLGCATQTGMIASFEGTFNNLMAMNTEQAKKEVGGSAAEMFHMDAASTNAWHGAYDQWVDKTISNSGDDAWATHQAKSVAGFAMKAPVSVVAVGVEGVGGVMDGGARAGQVIKDWVDPLIAAQVNKHHPVNKNSVQKAMKEHKVKELTSFWNLFG